VLDSDSLAPLSRLCWKHGFKLLLDECFREFLTSEKEKKVTHLVTYSGRSIRCDIGILCPGVRPNVGLAKAIGLKRRKGIVVDERMQTSAENIYAAGDAIETLNAATGKTEVMPLWQNAVEQGRVAGVNMAGGEERYSGAIWQNSLQVFGLAAATMGQSHQSHEIGAAKVLMSSGLKKGRGVRLVFSHDRLVGATLLGDTRNAPYYSRIIAERIPAWDFRNELLKENFNSLQLNPKFETAGETAEPATSRKRFSPGERSAT
jgi:NAD(P)H-nitrite reductase large subunit